MSRVIVTLKVELDVDLKHIEAYQYEGSRVNDRTQTSDEILIAMAEEDIEGVTEGMMTFDELGVLDLTFIGGEVVR